MNIYTKEGWLDIEHIADICDKNNINFIIIIGKRQVGKTYGVLKYILDNHKTFVFTRRVKDELNMLTKNVNSPFEKVYPGEVIFTKDSEYTAEISRLEKNEENETIKKRIGIGTALSSIGKIRGFNGDIYTDWIFDEFIPEEHLFKISNEGDAFLNAHTTINGNRELEGRPCIRTWLLANSNNLDSDILTALNVTKIVEKMSIRAEESRMLKDRGILILLPESKKVVEKRKLGGLYKAIGGDSKFSKMAYENEFAYNDYTDIRLQPLIQFNALITIGHITICLHKNNKTLYIVNRLRVKPKYILTDSDTDVMRFNREFADIRLAYLNGRCSFEDMTVKNYFLSLIK